MLWIYHMVKEIIEAIQKSKTEREILVILLCCPDLHDKYCSCISGMVLYKYSGIR